MLQNRQFNYREEINWISTKNKGGTTRYSIYGDLKLESIEELNKLKIKIKGFKIK